MDIITQLTEVGLQEREAKVYTALLELGDSTVLPIAQKSGIQRTYVYDILELLKKRGLVTYFEKNGRRRYVAEDPSTIETLLSARVTSFASILPNLRALHNNAPSKPKVQFYDGKAEVLKLYEHLIEVESYDCIYSHPHVIAIWGNYSTDMGKRVAANGVKARELLAISNPPPYLEYYSTGLQEVRYLPKDTEISIDFMLYENKVALVSYEDDIHTVIIESPGIVKSFRSLFNVMWESAQQ